MPDKEQQKMVDAFLEEVIAVCRKHNGGFEVVPGFNDTPNEHGFSYPGWLRQAAYKGDD